MSRQDADLLIQQILFKSKTYGAGGWCFLMIMLSAISNFFLENKGKFSKTGAYLSTMTIISIINIVFFFYISKEEDSNIKRTFDALETGIATSTLGTILQNVLRFSFWSFSKTKNIKNIPANVISTLREYSL